MMSARDVQYSFRKKLQSLDYRQRDKGAFWFDTRAICRLDAVMEQMETISRARADQRLKDIQSAAATASSAPKKQMFASLNLTGLDILQKIENQDNRWSYRLLYKDLWHADKKQDRNALAKPLLSILQEVEGGPLVKSKVLHLFRDSGVILLASGAGAFIKPPGKSRAPDGTAIGASPTPICSGAGIQDALRL
ncbi:hypothetical protein WJX77_010905 [Trebouxia sp. C0004]